MASESSAAVIQNQARDTRVGLNEKYIREWDKKYGEHMTMEPPNMYNFRPSDIPFPSREIVPIIDEHKDRLLALGDLQFTTYNGLVRSRFVLPARQGESPGLVDLVGVLAIENLPTVRVLLWEAKPFHRNGEPVITQSDFRRMQMGYELTAAITGGTDNLLEVARTLQALIVRRRYMTDRISGTVDLEGQIKKFFHNKIDTRACLKWFDTLDADFQDFSEENIGNARKIMLEHPTIYLAYVIDKLAGAMSDPNASKDPEFIYYIEDLFVKAQQVNLGRTNDSNNMIYANINDATSLLKEWWASQFPYAYALGREVVDTKNDLQYWSRWNSAFLTLLHTRFIADLGLVPMEAFENGSAIARGNAKSGASDVTEALLRNPQLGRDIDRLAEALHISMEPVAMDVIPSVKVANTRRHFVVMNRILEMAYREGVGSHEPAVKKLIADFRETMMKMEYYTRSLVSVQNPSQLDDAINQADALMRQIGGTGVTAFAAVDGADFHWQHFYELSEISQLYDGDHEAPSNFAIDLLHSVEHGRSPYMMFAVHLPTILEQKDGRMRIRVLRPEELSEISLDKVVPLEILINLEEWLFFCGTHRPEWEARGVGTNGISQDLIDTILEIVKSRVAQKGGRPAGSQRRKFEFENMMKNGGAGLGAHLEGT